MTLIDEPAWRGGIHPGGRGSGTANLEALTYARRVTIRGDIAPYPF